MFADEVRPVEGLRLLMKQGHRGHASADEPRLLEGLHLPRNEDN